MKKSFILFICIIWLIFPSRTFAQSVPDLKIVSPTQNQTILGDEATISFIVSGMQIGKEGHLHLWLDSQNTQASTATEIPTHFDYVLSSLPPGKHMITLEVVHPDHSSYSPPIIDTVQFLIQQRTILLPTSIPTVQSTYPILFDYRLYTALVAVGIVIIGLIIRSTLTKD